MRFYTYTWNRSDGTPYYVGKGSGRRAFTSYAHGVHRPEDRARILIQYWESEGKAFDMEKWWIALWGRKDNGTGILRNLTDGGENPPSWAGRKRPMTQETRKKISAALKGRKQPPRTEEHCRNIRKAKTGRPRPDMRGRGYRTGHVPWNKGKKGHVLQDPKTGRFLSRVLHE